MKCNFYGTIDSQSTSINFYSYRFILPSWKLFPHGSFFLLVLQKKSIYHPTRYKEKCAHCLSWHFMSAGITRLSWIHSNSFTTNFSSFDLRSISSPFLRVVYPFTLRCYYYFPLYKCNVVHIIDIHSQLAHLA